MDRLNKFWLSTEEIEDLTGAKTRKKQAKVLKCLGYNYKVRPDASIVVPVDQFQEHRTGLAPEKEYIMDFGALNQR